MWSTRETLDGVRRPISTSYAYVGSTCPVGFNLKFVRFISPFEMGVLYARIELLTFTLSKRHTGSLTRKQRTVGVGPRKSLLAKFFLAGVTCPHYDSRSESFEHTGCNFLFNVATTRDIRTVRSLHSSRHTTKQDAGNIGAFRFFVMLFSTVSFF